MFDIDCVQRRAILDNQIYFLMHFLESMKIYVNFFDLQ